MSKKIVIAAIDIEGTIITDGQDRTPRPCLLTFLSLLPKLVDKVVVMTALDESLFREIARDLVKSKKAPKWFETVEFVAWKHRGFKDLTLVDQDTNRVLLVDDYHANIGQSQKNSWYKIPGFYTGEENQDDHELCNVIELLCERNDITLDEDTRETLDILSDPAAMRQLKKSEEDAKEGRFVELEDILDQCSPEAVELDKEE